MLYHLKAVTVASLEAIREPTREPIFPPIGHYTTYRNHYKKLLKLAGLPYVKGKSGLQKVRRTFASHLEARGGNATAALGHSARRLTEQSYLDLRIVKEAAHNELLFDV